MTAVLPVWSHPGIYSLDQSEPKDHCINTLHYISDTDGEGYRGNPASPHILVGSHHRGESSRSMSRREPELVSSTGPQYSITRGRWGEGYRSRNGSRNGSRNNSMSNNENARERAQLSLVAMLLATVRKSLITPCRAPEEVDECSLDIGWPTDVEHVAHVTFDRCNGFLGLPQEFATEVPSRAPSASQSVFGVSAESMQCSNDRHGNNVPTILLLMQERLYHQGGLKAEGIFRINAENSHHEHVRDQLNKGIVPMDIDLHCLASLIKAWFRELPEGILDALSPEQVLECHTEEESVALVKLLPSTQAALLDWAINLMADVVEEEAFNKMNARNVAMVFAPNMTQVADPLIALLHAVQVMNLLKRLVLRTLKDRQEATLEQPQGVPAPEASEGDEPDSDCNNVVINEQQRQSSAREEDMSVEYDHHQYPHQMTLHTTTPTKMSAKLETKSGRMMVNTIEHNERVEAR